VQRNGEHGLNNSIINWTPAVKLIISLKPNNYYNVCAINNTGVLNLKVGQFNQEFEDFYELHRTVFWNSKGSETAAYMSGLYDFELVNKNDLYACNSWIKHLDPKCGQEAMVLITLANIHNSSFLIEKVTLAAHKIFHSGQIIQSPHVFVHLHFSNYKLLHPCMMNEFIFYKFETRRFHYCKESGRSNSDDFLDFSIWVEGFSVHIWLLNIFILISCRFRSAVCSYLEKRSKLVLPLEMDRESLKRIQVYTLDLYMKLR